MSVVAKILATAHVVAVAAVIGGFVAFFGSFFLFTLAGESNINGGLAMGSAGLMPIGAFAGALAGGWLSWKWFPGFERKSAMVVGFGLTAISLLSVGGYFLHQDLSDGDPYAAAEEPVFHIEWRLPEVVPHDRVDRIFRYTMRSSYMDWTLSNHWEFERARDEGGQTILRMRANLRWRVTGRIFQLWRAPNHDDRITVYPDIPRDPPHSEDYGAWVDVADAPGHAYRWRVSRSEQN